LRDPAAYFYWGTLSFGVTYAVAVMLVSILVALMLVKRKLVAWQRVDPSAWSFDKNWIPGVSVIGTGLTSVFAATNTINAVIPGFDLARLAALSLIFALVIAASTLMFSLGTSRSATTGKEQVHPGFLLLAIGFSMFGVGAQLAIMYALTRIADMENTPKLVLGLALLAAALLIGALAILTFVRAATAGTTRSAARSWIP
jgi:predicted membrane protein